MAPAASKFPAEALRSLIGQTSKPSSSTVPQGHLPQTLPYNLSAEGLSCKQPLVTLSLSDTAKQGGLQTRYHPNKKDPSSVPVSSMARRVRTQANTPQDSMLNAA